ncbi:MAG TPA: hypothetical protein VLG13_00370 [Patescibacteria group bacterium]|nr:hypothetical protein [Patescibacteria group bacterium]
MSETSSSTIDLERQLQASAETALLTPEFQAWASQDLHESGVIQEDGHPKVFYHGGRAGISTFSRDDPRHTPGLQGYYFSPLVNTAKYFAGTLKFTDPSERPPEDAAVYAVFLKVKNPYLVESGDPLSSAHIEIWPEGYDAIVNTTGIPEVVVREPDQIYVAASVPR